MEWHLANGEILIKGYETLLWNIFYLDGLLDCQDPECCSSPSCSRNQLCYTVPKPINILLQRQPPAQTASFFQVLYSSCLMKKKQFHIIICIVDMINIDRQLIRIIWPHKSKLIKKNYLKICISIFYLSRLTQY